MELIISIIALLAAGYAVKCVREMEIPETYSRTQIEKLVERQSKKTDKLRKMVDELEVRVQQLEARGVYPDENP